MFRIIAVDTHTNDPSDFVYDFPQGTDKWILILTHTPSIIRVNGTDVEYPMNHMVLFPPGQPIYYRACVDSFSNDWLHFTVTDHDSLPAQLPLGTPVFIPLGNQCHHLFELLCTENYLRHEFWESNADALIRLLLYKLLEFHSNPDFPFKSPELLKLRREIFRHPAKSWTIQEMAAYIHTSERQLQRLYKQSFHVTCMEDVINARIQLAKQLLANTDTPVTEIALLCGYNSSEHFFRQFRKYTGFSPRTYRTSKRPADHNNKEKE